MKISFNYRGRKIKINARKCGFFSTGLMFRTKKTMPCVFEFKKSVNFKISSLFVFFDFVAVWIDEKGKTIEK